jgi:ubiquinone/menaquinone biosynthesis C-methylase UbiE
MQFDELAKTYHGDTASTYEALRVSDPKWATEQEAMNRLLSHLPRGSTLLDIPVGTGRFVEMYKTHGLAPTGADVSQDMMSQAAARAEKVDLEMSFRKADVTKLAEASRSFDTALCIRLFNWLDMTHMAAAVSELTRVSRGNVIIGVRCWVPLAELGLGSIKGWALLTAQSIYWLKRAVRRATSLRHKLLIHDKAAVAAIFSTNGLAISKREIIERGRDGTEYVFYLLKKTTTD